MPGFRNPTRSRTKAGAAVSAVAIHAVLIAVLIWGLRARETGPMAGESELAAVVSFDTPPPPEPAPDPRPQASEEPAPAGVKADPVPVEAPAAALPLNPSPAAPVAGDGAQTRSGQSSAGTGTGAGGAGTGTGGGGLGSGSGGIASPARRVAGALVDADYPRAAEREGMAGTTVIAFRVRTDGRVDRCEIAVSSGHGLLDALTCRLFTQRFRFEPARTADGQPTESTLRTNFTWGTRRR